MIGCRPNCQIWACDGNCSSRRGQVPFFRHACATNPFGTRPPAYGAEAQGILNSTLPIYIARSAGTECGKWSGRGPSCSAGLGCRALCPLRAADRTPTCACPPSRRLGRRRGATSGMSHPMLCEGALLGAPVAEPTQGTRQVHTAYIYAHHAHHRRSSSARARSHAR